MYPRLLLVGLIAASAWSQIPAGRWDGTVVFGELKVPFRIDFEGSGAAFRGTLVNGDERVASTQGSFDGKKMLLSFESSSRLEATLTDGELKGTFGGLKQGMQSFTAAAFCTCGFAGEAGPDISGTWEAPVLGWRLTIQRKGEDTVAAVTRTGERLGPLTGRFDGLTFTLNFFDGMRGAVVELEPRKDGGLDVVWKAPGEGMKKDTAVRVASR